MFLTKEAVTFLKNSPSTVADIAYDLGKSLYTLNDWIGGDTGKEWPPAAVKIIATDMGKTIEEITTEKTEA